MKPCVLMLLTATLPSAALAQPVFFDDFDGNGLRIAHRNTSLSGGNSPGASASAMTPM